MSNTREPRLVTRARVSVNLEILLGDTWGPESTTGQVFDQASREAVAKLALALQPSDVRIVGAPTVVSVHVVARLE